MRISAPPLRGETALVATCDIFPADADDNHFGSNAALDVTDDDFGDRAAAAVVIACADDHPGHRTEDAREGAVTQRRFSDRRSWREACLSASSYLMVLVRDEEIKKSRCAMQR